MIVENSANSSNDLGEGNTNPPPFKQDAAACRWVFTHHNYSLTDINCLISFFNSSNSTFIFSEELGKSGETPHLQGYLEIKPKMRFTALKKCFASISSNLGSAHLGKSKGSRKENIIYITKEGGKVYHSGDIKIPRPVIKMTYDKLRAEQKEIVDEFRKPEDPLFGRKVYWFWEGKGGWGKSLTCMYFIDQMDAFVVQGKNNDILCGITKYIEKYDECPPIVIFDIPRVNEGHVSYQAIEALKCGYFFSGKYESGMIRFNKPHVIIFSNEKPEEWKLTENRWIIKELVHPS